jgi:hypothetical protein
MPTVIGIIFFVTAACVFFLDDDKLFSLLIFSAIFSASSVVALSDAGIEPYYLVGALFVLQSIYRVWGGTVAQIPFRGKRWMIFFAGVAIISAFTLPFIFAGIPVYEPHVGIDAGLFLRPPLHFAHANISHSVSVLLGVLVVLGGSQNFKGPAFSEKAYRFTFYFLAGVVFLQFLCSVLGFSFPYALLQNNAGVSLQNADTGEFRFAGTFTESSGAGAVLAAFTAGFLAEKVKHGKSIFPAFVGLFTIMLVRSTASMFAIGMAFVLLLIFHPIFRSPYRIDMVRLRRTSLLIVIAAIVLGAILFSPLRESVVDLTVNKQEGGSFIDRTAADAYALTLFVQTHGIGVGMGSNRPSSLIPSLLSTVGVLGLVGYLMAYFKLLSNAVPSHPELRWAGLALLFGMVAAGPDFDAPWIWVFLAFVVRMGQGCRERNHAECLSSRESIAAK